MVPEVKEQTKQATYGLADELALSGQKDIEAAKEGLGFGGSLLVDVGVGGAQLVGDIGLGMATGGGAMIPLATRAFGGGTQESRWDGASEKESFTYGAASAALSAGIERLSSVGNIASKAFGKGAFDDIATNAIRSLENRVGSDVGRTIVNRIATAGLQGLGEGAEEGIEAIINPFLRNATYADDPIVMGEVLGDALYNATVGSIIGGVAGGIGGTNTRLPIKPQTVQNHGQVQTQAVQEHAPPAEVMPPVVDDRSEEDKIIELIMEQEMQKQQATNAKAPPPATMSSVVDNQSNEDELAEILLAQHEAKQKDAEQKHKTPHTEVMERDVHDAPVAETTPAPNRSVEHDPAVIAQRVEELRKTFESPVPESQSQNSETIVPGQDVVQKSPLSETSENTVNPVAKTESQPYTETKQVKHNTVRTKKGDWTSTDVEWTAPSQKRPVAYSTVSTSNGIEVMADEHPTATIRELIDVITYDTDAKQVLQQYVDAGYGEQVANEWFSYKRQLPSTKTKHKGDIANEYQKETLGEIHGHTGVSDTATSGSRDGGLLDRVPSKDVQANESRRDTVQDIVRRGDETSRPASGPDAAGIPTGRSVGSGEGRDLRPPTRVKGEPSESTTKAETSTSKETEPTQEEHAVVGKPSAEVAPDEKGNDTSPPIENEQQTTTKKQIEKMDALAVQEKPKGTHFTIPEKGVNLPVTPKNRYKANVTAITSLHDIMSEGRMATPQEQEILSKYTGWGGISDVFDGNKDGWTKEFAQLKELLNAAEYKTAKSSILDAYYTEPSIIRGMYNGLTGLGFTGGRLLEPSAGVGRFLGAMPKDMMAGVQSWTAVELDKVTGNIAKYLYPDADVRVQGYESANIPDNYMDVVIGNVPFGNIPVTDKKYPGYMTKSIHNYFIAKSLDKVRPGGILMVITSRETMDATGDSARAYFMNRANLVGAIRLPNTAFQGTGTNVVSDILVFKKRKPNTMYGGAKFLTSQGRTLTKESGVYATVNEYFAEYPEMVLGTPKNTSGRYGTTLTYDPLESRMGLQKQIEKALSRLRTKMDYPVQQTQEQIRADIKADAGKTKQGGIIRKDGAFYKNNDGNLVEVSDIAKADTLRMGNILEIRDVARSLLDAQLDGASDIEIRTIREKLNTIYDAFVKKHGVLNGAKNRKLAALDVDSPFVQALEIYNRDEGTAKKADIFTKNTVSPVTTVTHADSVDEALTVSMNETGTVDVQRIAQLTSESVEAVEREMLERSLVFLNRNGVMETAEQYLSGNVRAKLRDAQALAEGDDTYLRNVKALEEVVPAYIPAEEIKVRVGATWVPDGVYSDFASKMLGSNGLTWRGGRQVTPIQVTYNRPLGKFFIDVNDSYLHSRPENSSTWGTSDVPFVGGRSSILESALNNKTVAVWRTKDDKRVMDKDATIAAQGKLEKVLAEFQNWLWSDEGRRTELGELYNDMFNNTVTPKYDGSHLTVNGSNPAMQMRPHQVNAVQRIINSGGNTLLAHRVGAGKTYEMAAAAMKLRQLGIVKKPLFTVPKHLVAQWGNEFLSYFPAAKILILEANDFTPVRRKLFANRIATGDYDAVIMSYEQFGMIPMSAEKQEGFFQDQIEALELAILENKRANGKKDPSVRDMERSKKSFEAKIKKLGDSKKDEGNIDFEQMGIDALFVDEAHNFKNLFYSTKMQGIADLGNKDGSQRAFDLYMKVRFLQGLNGGRGIVFATATPIMNSVVELYTMQRYLQGDLLDARGLSNFDAWANQFGDVVTIRKMKTGGNGYDLKQSLSKYKNLAEMQQMFRSFADVIVDAADLPYLKIPTMETGKRIVVECTPSAFQEKYMEELGKRAEKIRGAGKGGDQDHIFKIFDEGKKISYTQRMIDNNLPYESGGKIMKCVENVSKVWQDTKADKGTQLIFCDRGTPGGTEAERGVSLYDDIKNLLVGTGIPANEIVFIHQANTDEAKSKLFKDVNDGNVRVLIGSTSKMGTGMNAQRRIAAIHELNAPDRPGDLEQNEGRGLRQGNMNDEVAVYSYITKKTFDSRQWDNLKRKATFIHQIMSGQYNGREADGDGDLALSAAEISAIASDNPLIMEQFDVSEKIANLETLERAHGKERAEAQARITNLNKEIERDENYLKRIAEDNKNRQDTTGGNFAIVVNGKTYTDRKAGGEALIAVAKKHLNVKDAAETNTAIGDFAGLKLSVTSRGDMLLKGKAQYRSNVNMEDASGTISRLQKLVERIGTMKKQMERQLAEDRAAISKLQQTASATFDKTQELIDARVRESEIMEELNPQSEQNLDISDTGADTDGTVDLSVETDAPSHPERWSAERVGDEGKRPMRIAEIIEKIRHDFEINITKGHVRGAGVQGQYDQKNGGIRAKIANDLPTIAHELGHALNHRYELLKKPDKNTETTNGFDDEMETELTNGLGEDMKELYPDDKWASEGLAEYVRKYLQNREVAIIDYPKFTKYFLNKMTVTDSTLLEQLADEVNAYYSLDVDTATSSIRLREEGLADATTIEEKIRNKMSVVYQAWVDSNHGIKLFDDATGANTYKIASNAAYSDSIAGQLIVGDLTDADGRYVAPGLKAALKGVDLNDKKMYRLLGEYLTVKHGPERLAEGMRIFADDRKNSTAFMQRRQEELELQYPQFEEVSDRLYEFQKQFLQTWAVGTGLVSSKSANDWGERWAYYVPLNRTVGAKMSGMGAKRGFANQNSTIKKATGSGLDIVHPVDNIVNNIVKMVNAGTRNNVMQSITRAAETLEADAAFLEKVPTPMVRKSVDMKGVKAQLTDWFEDTDVEEQGAEIVSLLDDVLVQYGKGKSYGDVITVMKGGKQEFWKINDPLLLESLMNMSSQKTGGILDGILEGYGAISRFMTMNLTGNNIVWSIFSNFPRDMGTFFTYSKNRNPVEAFSAIGSAYINKVKGENADPLYKEFLALGGGKSSAYTADRKLAKRSRKSLSSKKFSKNPLDWISLPLDWISFVSDTVELGPRYATFKLMRQAGMSSQEAFYDSMDITVNFRRHGSWSKQMNQVVPFFNASVQGLDKFQRWITASDAPVGERKKVIRIRMSTFLSVSIALAATFYAINNDDEEAEKNYQQLSNFTKNNYWNIPLGDGKYFAIPKPRELAVLSSFFETCMERGIGDNDRAFNGFYEYASGNFLPPIASDMALASQDGFIESGMGVLGSMGALGVVAYLGANRDFLGNPIVSNSLNKLESRDQYTDRTSKIAYQLGQAYDASPIQIDFFFQQILGGWWKGQRALFPVGSENVDLTLGVQNTYIKDNQYSTDLVNWMYDKVVISEKAKKSDDTNMDKAITYKMDTNMTRFYSSYNRLAKTTPDSTASRATRQTVLNMILEYQKAADAGTTKKVQNAVYAVCKRERNIELLPSVMSSSVTDGKNNVHTLSATQYVEYQTDYLRRYWENMEESIGNARTDVQKSATVKAAESTARDQATEQILARMNAPRTDYATDFKGVETEDVVTFRTGRNIAYADGGLKQAEVTAIIMQMLEKGLSFDDAYMLFHSEYEKDTNNPWANYRP